jgi:uncharacterized iron-regulated membrane protein
MVLVALLWLNFSTGLLLLFSDEMKMAGRPDLWLDPPTSGATVPFGQIYDNILAADPGAKPAVIQRSHRPWFGDTTYGRSSDGKSVIFVTRPDDGLMIGVTTPRDSLFRDVVRGLHTSYLVKGRIGRIAISVLSLFLLTMIITGLIAYRRFWRGLLRWPPVAAEGRQRAGAMHRLFALWLLPFLLLVGLTAFYYFLNDLNVVDRALPAPKVAERTWVLPEGFSGTELDGMINKATSTFPELVTTVVVIPGTKNEALKIVGYDPAKGKIFGATEITIDPLGQRVTAATTLETQPFAMRLWPLVTAVHYANWGGIYSNLLWAIFGLGSLIMLTYAGRLVLTRRRVRPPSA